MLGMASPSTESRSLDVWVFSCPSLADLSIVYDRDCSMSIQFHFLLLLDTQLDYIFQPPLQFGETMWLSHGQRHEVRCNGDLKNRYSPLSSLLFPFTGWSKLQDPEEGRVTKEKRPGHLGHYMEICLTKNNNTYVAVWMENTLIALRHFGGCSWQLFAYPVKFDY